MWTIIRRLMRNGRFDPYSIDHLSARADFAHAQIMYSIEAGLQNRYGATIKFARIQRHCDQEHNNVEVDDGPM